MDDETWTEMKIPLYCCKCSIVLKQVRFRDGTTAFLAKEGVPGKKIGNKYYCTGCQHQINKGRMNLE